MIIRKYNQAIASNRIPIVLPGTIDGESAFYLCSIGTLMHHKYRIKYGDVKSLIALSIFAQQSARREGFITISDKRAGEKDS